ncbi:uncharacterized protein F5147DRAFT_687162, partial [Suillus discolor]
HRLPDFPYTRASSSFSAVVQLYARSSQLDTAEVRHRRFRDMPPTTRGFGHNIGRVFTWVCYPHLHVLWAT